MNRASIPVGHVSASARVLLVLLGTGLCVWVLSKLRRRSVLVPICVLFLAIGLGTIAFAVYPDPFDRLSSLIGIYYPPVLYLLIAFLALMVVILYLASRLSISDERSRRVAQELALSGYHGKTEGDAGDSKKHTV